jgi:hypothetical protein
MNTMSISRAPVNVAVNVRSATNRTREYKCIESGEELLGQFTMPQQTTTANPLTAGLLYHSYLSPRMLFGTRLRGMSKMYGQYRFMDLAIRIVPGCSTAADGQLSIAIDRNVTEEVPTSSALQYVTSLDGFSQNSVFMPTTVKAPAGKSGSRQNMYLTDLTSELAENTQFRLLIATAVPTTTITGGVTFTIFIKYKVVFDNPINFGIDMAPPFPGFSQPKGSVNTLSSTGNLTGSTGIFPAASTANGAIWALSPQLVSTSSLATGQTVGAVMCFQVAAGDAAEWGAFSDVRSALVWIGSGGTTATGNIDGSGSPIAAPNITNWVPTSVGNPTVIT